MMEKFELTLTLFIAPSKSEFEITRRKRKYFTASSMMKNVIFQKWLPTKA